ncbi:hypothetical protein J2T20_002235 [Paenibacillus wynnii]|nr:hypothetical protein [Paenibacillus wynnii]
MCNIKKRQVPANLETCRFTNILNLFFITSKIKMLE